MKFYWTQILVNVREKVWIEWTHIHIIHTMVFWYLRAWESCSCLIPEAGYLRCWNNPIVSVSQWRSWEHNNCLVYTAGDLENLEGSWRVIGPFDSCTEIRTNFFSAGIRSGNRINSLVAKWKTLNELELSMFLQFMLPILKIMQKLNIKCKELSKSDIDDFK